VFTTLLSFLRVGQRHARRPRGLRRTQPAAFLPGVEQLDERYLPSAHPVVPLAALTLEPGHLRDLRGFRNDLHLGPLYARLPDLGAGATAASPSTFVGAVPGTNLLVGVVLGPQQALAYVCDGAGTSGWLRGPVKGQALDLTGKKGERLVAQVRGHAVSGTLTLPRGPALAFTAGRAADGESGLFRSVARFGRQGGVLSLIRLGSEERGNMRNTSTGEARATRGGSVVFVSSHPAGTGSSGTSSAGSSGGSANGPATGSSPPPSSGSAGSSGGSSAGAGSAGGGP
jgi:hypothetical protein